jgi:hypothetical protein
VNIILKAVKNNHVIDFDYFMMSEQNYKEQSILKDHQHNFIMYGNNFQKISDN